MSLLNVLMVDPDLVEVYVDTRVAAVDKSHPMAKGLTEGGESSKLFMLPADGCVIAGRGSMGFLSIVAANTLARFGDGFDGLLQFLPKLLEEVYSELARTRERAGVRREYFAAQEIALVGWSEQANAMAAVLFVREGDQPTFEALHLMPGESWITPWFEDWGPMPARVESQSVPLLASEQAGHVLAEDPAAGIGGRLLCASVSRDQCQVRLVCHL